VTSTKHLTRTLLLALISYKFHTDYTRWAKSRYTLYTSSIVLVVLLRYYNVASAKVSDADRTISDVVRSGRGPGFVS